MASNSEQLLVEVLQEGSGPQAAAAGDTITVNYSGWLPDGTLVDSSENPGRSPFSFVLGEGQVIDGWDQGIVGMRVGEKVRLTIPAELAYGSSGQGPIPPNSTLIFEVHMLSIVPG